MDELADGVKLLAEYNQWRATREVTPIDTSPEEFMRDRVKEIALTRIEDALHYINASPKTPHSRAVERILNGQFEYRSQDNGAAESDSEDVGEQPNETPTFGQYIYVPTDPAI